MNYSSTKGENGMAGNESDDAPPRARPMGSKVKPMWGDETYQKRAQQAFPLLRELARAGKTATYGEFAKRLRIPNARSLNYVLGSVGASLDELSAAWRQRIPPIEALVINVHTSSPGSEVSHFLSSLAGPVPTDRQGRIRYVQQAVFRYSDWDKVQNALLQAPIGIESAADGTRADSKSDRQCWWVNHSQTFRQELDGEYLWSPKRNSNGAKNVSYDNMMRVMPGDVVFSFADAEIRAVGVALGRAREAPKPPKFGKAGDQGGKAPGWQVPVRFKELDQPLRPKDHAAELAPVLPNKHSPIRRTGDRNQGVYLAAIPASMADTLRRLLGKVEQIVDSIALSTGGGLASDAAEEAIQQRTDIGPTVKKTLVNARRGQGWYRVKLEQVEQKCRVTGVLDRRHLRATHIKPWYLCDDREKLDGFNGLLLSPHVEHLFDRGYISFSDSGELLVAQSLNPAVLRNWGITVPRNVGPFRAEQCKYLEYHRREVFEKEKGGAGRPSETHPPGVQAVVIGN